MIAPRSAHLGEPGRIWPVRPSPTFARAGLVLVVVGLALLATTWFHPEHYLNPAAIQRLLTASGPLAPLALMALMAAVVVAVPLPSLPIDIAAGAYFGPWLGTLYAATGALAGAVASFVIARWLGRNQVERLVHGHISFCTACSDKLLTRLVFVARLLPVVSFKAVSYGAGLTKMSVGRFALATFLGMLPLTFAYVSAGRLLVGHGALPIVVGVLVVAGFLALPMVIERFDLFGLRAMFHHDPEDGEPRARADPEPPRA